MLQTVGAYEARRVPPMSRKPTHADLLERIAQNGDVAAFEVLFNHFGPRIRSVALRQGADHPGADEIVQETMMTVWRKAALFAPDKGAVTTWVFTIARNISIDRMRGQRIVWQVFDETTDTRPADDPPPDEAVSAKQTQERVRQAMHDLPADQLEVVQLSFVEGLSHGAIAQRLGLPLGTIKSRLRLAYARVRATLQGDL